MQAISGALLSALLVGLLFVAAAAQGSRVKLTNGTESGQPQWRVVVKDPAPVAIKRSNSERVQDGLFQCPCSPSGRGTVSGATAVMAQFRKDVDELKKVTGGIAQEANKRREEIAKKLLRESFKCIEKYRMEACVNADRDLRGKGLESMCIYDTTTQRNLHLNGSEFSAEYTTVGSCELNALYNLSSVAAARRGFEGCVAVEHLEGYVLQHPTHLRRPVLCARGFCATPNHGIYVNGEYTSMKQMCAAGGPWDCTARVTLVNNLKIAANRRAKVSDEITVTPYDVRFPKPAIWAVQILEDAWNMLALSVCTGSLAGVAVLLLSKAETRLQI